jgi:hypothetical protein
LDIIPPPAKADMESHKPFVYHHSLKPFLSDIVKLNIIVHSAKTGIGILSTGMP